jgi:hypothetical protein
VAAPSAAHPTGGPAVSTVVAARKAPRVTQASAASSVARSADAGAGKVSETPEPDPSSAGPIPAFGGRD